MACVTAMVGEPGVVACANRPRARVHTARRLYMAWFARWGYLGDYF